MPSQSATRRKADYFAVLSFIFVGFVLYINTLDVPFYFDDSVNIMNPALRMENLSVDSIVIAGQEGLLKKRPVSNISFAFNYFLGEYNVHGYHLINITIHICTAIFLFLFLKATLGLPVNQDKYRNFPQLAWITALLWLAHPLATQSVTYIVQRMNSMATMFYLLSLLFYVYGRKKHFISSLWNAIGWYIACFTAGILAIGSKEIALTLPFFVFLYEWYFIQNLNKNWLKRKIPWLAALFFIGLCSVYFYTNGHPFRSIAHGCDRRYFTLPERLLTEGRVVMHYIGLILYPNPERLVFDHNFSLSKSLLAPITTLFSLAAIIGSLLFALFIARRERLLSFCLLWFFGNLVIESTVICLEIIYEHRTYLPSMFLLLFFTALLYRLIKRNIPVTTVLLIFVVLLGFWTFQRNIIWKDPILFWTDSVNKNPNKPRSINNLGVVYFKKGNSDIAKQKFARVIELYPDYPASYNNLGSILLREGKYDKAESYFVKALTLNPNYIDAHLNLASVYLGKKQLQKAINEYQKILKHIPDLQIMKNLSAQVNKFLGQALVRNNKPADGLPYLQKALQTKPKDANLHLYIGEALMYLGRLNEAMEHMKEAVKLDNQLAPAHYNLAMMLALQKNSDEEALLHYKEAAISNPSPIPLQYNLGNLLFRMGRLEEAEQNYKLFLQISPEIADAHNNLGLIYIKLGQPENAIKEFQATLAINPEHQLAKRNLELLRGELQENQTEKLTPTD